MELQQQQWQRQRKNSFYDNFLVWFIWWCSLYYTNNRDIDLRFLLPRIIWLRTSADVKIVDFRMSLFDFYFEKGVFCTRFCDSFQANHISIVDSNLRPSDEYILIIQYTRLKIKMLFMLCYSFAFELLCSRLWFSFQLKVRAQNPFKCKIKVNKCMQSFYF